MATYYHGGTPDLRRGTVLLPPTKTKIISRTWALIVEAGHASDSTVQRQDKVYLTTDPSIAKFYAMQWSEEGGGSNYKVEVDDSSLEIDPDLGQSGCWTADSAKILGVHDPRVSLDQKFIDDMLNLMRAKTGLASKLLFEGSAPVHRDGPSTSPGP